MTITIKKNLQETVKVDYKEIVEADKTSKIGKNLTEDIGDSHIESVKKDYTLKAKKIQITAQDEISLKTGKASILMKKMAISPSPAKKLLSKALVTLLSRVVKLRRTSHGNSKTVHQT